MLCNTYRFISYQVKRIENLGPGIDPQQLCIMCATRQINVTFLPCEHTVTCNECGRRVIHGKIGENIQKKCPECKVAITDYVL